MTDSVLKALRLVNESGGSVVLLMLHRDHRSINGFEVCRCVVYCLLVMKLNSRPIRLVVVRYRPWLYLHSQNNIVRYNIRPYSIAMGP